MEKLIPSLLCLEKNPSLRSARRRRRRRRKEEQVLLCPIHPVAGVSPCEA